ncbi:hypothetical protein B0I35DRAFT_46526 [Stachybotrys elegans]|uniref:Uncharacterized protein n=1 Tax=Stachybotrys elegans TaxID=80388 RepID=A0A8K0T305_9HYPO|nr:hypothetical protein B0I35DRAFT_46526 [Stachybotrys elegans]
MLAAKAGAEDVFRALSKCAHLHVVLRELLRVFNEESKVIWWFSTCLEEQALSATITDDDLLFQCMAQFPHGSKLVKLVIDRRVSPSAMKTMSICPSWPPEPCTPVIWALFARPRIENDPILALLSRCNAELPTYKTPKTKISAAFACLLDKTRIPILNALLEKDRDHVLAYTIPGPIFSHIASYPEPITEVVDEELTLDMAALHLGNLKAFQSLGGGGEANDGSLHIAAQLALPDFVDYLLDQHDPNHKTDGGGIPLAMACGAKENSWCKFANEEGDYRDRQNRTIQQLAKQTRSDWKWHGTGLLHIALENGVRVTEMMIEALDILNDVERDERYLYLDKEGLYYSPYQWLLRFRPDIKEAEALARCLTEAGLSWQPVAPSADWMC